MASSLSIFLFINIIIVFSVFPALPHGVKLPFRPKDVLPLLPRHVSWPILNSLHSAVDLLPTFVGAASDFSSNQTLEWKGACFYNNTAWMEFHNKTGSEFGGGTLHIKVCNVKVISFCMVLLCVLGVSCSWTWWCLEFELSFMSLICLFCLSLDGFVVIWSIGYLGITFVELHCKIESWDPLYQCLQIEIYFYILNFDGFVLFFVLFVLFSWFGGFWSFGYLEFLFCVNGIWSSGYMLILLGFWWCLELSSVVWACFAYFVWVDLVLVKFGVLGIWVLDLYVRIMYMCVCQWALAQVALLSLVKKVEGCGQGTSD